MMKDGLSRGFYDVTWVGIEALGPMSSDGVGSHGYGPSLLIASSSFSFGEDKGERPWNAL